MRATARVAFQRYIEECKYDQQELARLEAEEAARLAEEQATAVLNFYLGECEDTGEKYAREENARLTKIKAQCGDVRAIATLVLSHFNLESHVEQFLACSDGLAILANCCNIAAKCYDDALYEHKPTLINLATENHPECWQSGGVVYIETCVGQVSFHALYGEDTDLPEANGRVWSELEYQVNADLVALAFIEGWSKEVLQRTIGEKSAASEELAA